MAATLKFSQVLTDSDLDKTSVLIVGHPKNLSKLSYSDVQRKIGTRVSEEVFSEAVSTVLSSPSDSISLWLNRATIATLPTKCSRHNTPSRTHALTKIIKNGLSGGEETVILVCERSDLFASVCAIARALPLYHTKTSSTKDKSVTVEFYVVDAESRSPTVEDIDCFTTVAEGVRLAARIVDTPCSDMHTNAFLDEIRRVGAELKINPLIIQGEELQEKGFGGIYNVGKAAITPPALAVLSHRPQGASTNIAWVGKGIVFDTGGLCIKSKASMCGMKRDCGGAAGVLGAFYTAVKMGFSENLHAVFCLADNAVGPNSLRPDDIITMYSGRTVEINNTDAEGRLVLGDGVAYAQKDLKADVIVDMATLTGASGISTGRYHASIVTNSENWELYSVKAGQNSGDLVHPMLYCPELHFPEFASSLADMKNSVADRSNAQVSCAALFIASHIGFDFPGIWFHIDMASPVHVAERATGYGVALLATMFGRFSSNDILRSIAPAVSLCDAMETDTENSDSVKKMKVI